MTLYGIRSIASASLVEGGFLTEGAALQEIQRREVDGEDTADLDVEELCDDHPVHAAIDCPDW